MRYYITNDAGDEVDEHQGNIRGARRIAKERAKEREENLFINDMEGSVVECIMFFEE